MLGRLMDKIKGEEGDSDQLLSLERTSSKLHSVLHSDAAQRSQEHELEVRLANVDDEAVELTRTPSTQRDIDAATAAGLRSSFALKQAGRAQRLRAQLRALDADIAEVKSEILRASLLRGPSDKRFTCDEMCIVGGCSEEFAEDEGVFCKGCKLFLCHACFGATVVKNECQIGGRFDTDLSVTVEDKQRKSAPGSLPCPMFPQGCSCGHISLHEIQKAMLDRRNRGRDGEVEDINSPGTSPHKTYLLARRRWAEAQVEDQEAGSGTDDDVPLVRTFTESRRIAAARGVGGLARTNSGARSALADKLNELAELLSELAAHPVTESISKPKLRTCAQCHAQFADFEGGQCLFMRHSHFMCAVCYGGYIMRACSVGGVFEQEIRNSAGSVISARGQLPCPFFEGHTECQLVSKKSAPGSRSKALGLVLSPTEKLAHHLGLPEVESDTGLEPQQPTDAEPEPEPQPDRPQLVEAEPCPEVLSANPLAEENDPTALDCHCGAVPSAVIEAILLDPRNRSHQYWRERHADMILRSQAGLQISISIPNQDGALPAGWERERDELSGSDYYVNNTTGELRLDPPPPEHWSREVELLGRSFTPQNVHDTARLRVAITENLEIRKELERLEETRNKAMSPDDVALAELRMQVIDALDRGGSIRCPRCGVRAIKDDACIHMDTCGCGSHWCFLCTKENCPRGRGGCDEVSYYLEQHPGWGNFALPDSGENAAFAAQQEFLRRRQAFMVGAVKAHTDTDLWTRLRQEHADLLQNVPTKGRHIDWDTLDEADVPLFGANKRRAEENGGESVDAQRRRMREHWANVRLEEELDRRREVVQRRMEQCCVPVVTVLVAAVVVGTAVMMQYFPPESPMVLRDDNGWGSSLTGHNATPSPAPAPSATDSGSSWSSSGSNGGDEDYLADGECNGWACQTVVWGPRGQFALGGLMWLFCLGLVFSKQGCKELCQYFGAMLLLGGLGYWPLIMSPAALVEMHWAVAYIVCTTCTGVLQPLFITIPLATALDALEHLESANSCLLFVSCSTCQLCIWLIVYAIALVDVRSSYEIPEHDSGLAVSGGGAVVEPEPEAHVGEFTCGFFCSAVPWFSRVQAGVGLLSLVLAGVGWCIRARENPLERDDVLSAGVWVFLTVVGAGISLWPSTLSGEETCTTGWWVAYIFAPFCVVVLGPFWASCNIVCCFHWLVPDWDGDEDEVFNIAAVMACCCGVGYLVAIVVTRVSNSDWEPASLDLTHLECNAWCEVLFSAPLVEIGIGCISMFITALLKCHGRRADDYPWASTFALAIFFGGLAWWPALLFMVILPESLLEMNAWVATITVPLWIGNNGTLWTLLAIVILLEHVRDESMENIFGNFETFLSMTVSACVVISVGYITSVHNFRANAILLHENHTDMPPEPEALYEFICTWPCRLVWGLVSFAVGSGLFSLVSFFRWLCVGPEDHRLSAYLRCQDRQQCSCRCVLASSFQIATFVAIVGLAVYEGVYGYPLAIPVEGLVAGSAFWTYLLLPGMTSIGTVCSWKTLMRSSSPRVRMLSRLYKAPTMLGILTLVGSAWLLYVLRHSVDIKGENERSDHSKLILLQAVGIPYIGVSMMLWCWGTWRGEARRQVCMIVARPLLLWIPAATWPVVMVAASNDRDVLDKISLVWPLVSMAVSLMGFSSEIAWFCWKRQLAELNGEEARQREMIYIYVAMCTSVLASGALWAVLNVALLP